MSATDASAPSGRRAGSGERVIVVGAGIAGLAAAFRLRQAGLEVLVLEGEAQPGGRMATITKGGFTIDIGASLLPSSHRATRRLIKDAGLQGEVQRKLLVAGVLRDGRIHRLGPSPLEPLRTELFSRSAKAGLVKGVLTARKRARGTDWGTLAGLERFDGETVADYAHRELGPELLEYFVEPVLGSIFFAPPEQLSAVDLLWALTSFSPLSFNSDRGGDFLVNGLARLVCVQSSARVETVTETGAGVEVSYVERDAESRVETADACVLTVPAWQVAKLYPQLDDERGAILSGLEYSTSVSVHLGLTDRPAEQAVGVFVPRREDPDLCIAVFDHLKAKGRAPQGKGLLATYWRDRWGIEQWDRDDDLVVKTALPSIAKVLPDVESSVEIAHVQRWRRGMMSRPGTYRDMARFGRLSPADSPVQLCGDYFGVGSSVDSSLASGERAAERLIRRFGR